LCHRGNDLGVNARSMLLCFAAMLLSSLSFSQYQENPLNNSTRYFLGGGLNTMDRAAVCGEFVFSRKGEGPLIETRLGFSREMSGLPSDTCTTTNNWQLEPGIFLGDGWRFGKLTLTGALGLNMSFRQYCRIEGYEERMKKALLPALGARISSAVQVSNRWQLQINLISNIGFRNAYYGATIGVAKYIKG